MFKISKQKICAKRLTTLKHLKHALYYVDLPSKDITCNLNIFIYNYDKQLKL